MRAIADKYEAQDAARDDVMDLASGLQAQLFATRDTIEEAYEYAYSIVGTLPVKDQAAVITAMQVLINTIAEKVKQAREV
jgi:predicted membrane GTPase involved in stress response